jgi:hypothetical protein
MNIKYNLQLIYTEFCLFFFLLQVYMTVTNLPDCDQLINNSFELVTNLFLVTSNPCSKKAL